MVLSMTFVAGLMDAVAFLGIGDLFVAMVTGNVALLGFAVAGAHGHSAAEILIAVSSFFTGALIGARLCAQPTPPARPRPLAVATGTHAGLLMAGLALVAAADATGNRWRYLLIVTLALAMGLQNAAARSLGVPDIPTNVLTTHLTMIAIGSRLGGGSGKGTGRRLVAPIAMFCGALVGGTAILAFGPVVPLAIAVTLATLATAVAARHHILA
ncbi:MAG: DUF1275 domain-containing protein [Frankia sp.]|nr:DUF1275 domain-containing protein [Frankia sp.]